MCRFQRKRSKFTISASRQISEPRAVGLGEGDDAHCRRADAPFAVEVEEVESAIAAKIFRVDRPFKPLRRPGIGTRARGGGEHFAGSPFAFVRHYLGRSTP